MWPDRRLMDLFKIEHPDRARADGGRDGLGTRGGSCGSGRRSARCLARCFRRTDCASNSLKFARAPKSPSRLASSVTRRRCRTMRARMPGASGSSPIIRSLAIDPAAPVPSANRAPFDAEFCAVVEELKPQVVSFHFGLPEAALVKRVKAAGCVVIGSATTTAEARWLEAARRRRGDRARVRGRRPSRHVSHRQYRVAGRHVRAGAAGGRRGEGSGDRRRRHRRRARDRRRRLRWARRALTSAPPTCIARRRRFRRPTARHSKARAMTAPRSPT